MSFEISTERASVRPAREAAERGAAGEVQGAGFEAWHLFLLLAMGGATVAVMLSRHTSPAALLLLSATVLAAGVAGLAIHRALAAFFFPAARPRIRGGQRLRDTLVGEKQLVLRAIKELEFDRKMGKVSEDDYHMLATSLRAHAITLMHDIDQTEGRYRARIDADLQARLGPAGPSAVKFCVQCGGALPPDAKFCGECGRKRDAAPVTVS